MPVPKAILDLTAGCEQFVSDFRPKQAAYMASHPAGKAWRGSSEDAASHSRVRSGETMGAMRGDVGLPASVDVRVNEYEGDDTGWFATFTAKPGGGYTLTIDGAGRENHAQPWQSTE